MDGVNRRGLVFLRNLLFLLGLCTYSFGCAQSAETPDQNTEVPVPITVDQKFAHVFSALDGIWSGEFIIYEHASGQNYRGKIPAKLDHAFLAGLDLKETNRIQVRQEYISESPYFQRVKITDTYRDEGVEKSIESSGVNKVENGELWCVVEKPNEKIIHQGSSPMTDVIIWQGYDKSPLRREYFYETVLTDTYEIVGYGYYGEDDVKKKPKLWFYGKYDRVK